MSAEKATERAAEQRRDALLELSDRIREIEDVHALSFEASSLLGRLLDVSRVSYGTIDHDAETLSVDRDWLAPGVESLAGTLNLRAYGSFIDDLKHDKFVIVSNVDTDHRTKAPEAAAALKQQSAASFVNVPVVEKGRLAAVFFVNNAQPRNWAADDLDLIKEFADRVRTATERLRMTEALRATNADLERQVVERTSERGHLWQVSPDLLSVIDIATGRFNRVNPAWAMSLGWSSEEIEEQLYERFVHPDDVGASAAAFEQAQAGDPVLRFENRYRHKGGGWRWLSWVSVPEGGKLYSTTRDVTEEKANAAALALAIAERDRVWQTSPDLLVVLDFEGIFRRVNPEWTAVLGYREEELVGTRVDRLVHPDDVALTEKALVEAAGGPLPTVENRYRHKDGGDRWISWVTPPPENGLIYATGRHVTAEKQQQAELEAAQEALRQSQKMEAVGQLTGGLAHDFNNLLAGISGSLEMMQARLQQGRVSDLDRYMTAAQGAAKRAAALTHRLLAFSRRQTLDPRPTDVNRLIGGMQELIQRTVGPGIELEVVGVAAVWTTLVDPSQLENALLNLCINARDAMPEGGRITIETANRWLDYRAARQQDIPEGQYLSMCVTDTGVGMSPEIIERVFEPFFTTKPLGEGTGLGLSMIYGFAKQSGGQVRIYSEAGDGTTVCIYLPRHLGEAEADERKEPSTSLARSEQSQTVLVVDDEPTVRMLIADILADLGYNALEAADSIAGLKILQSAARIDLLVTDVGLPGGMNGRQMADAARAFRHDLKVLFITGYAENAVLGAGKLDPGMAVLTKPFAMDAMAARIRQMIEAPKVC